MNRRKLIEMSPEEIDVFLREERVAIASSIGPRGWPHSMPLWYVVRDGTIWAWTFRKSQKIKNLERDPRVTVLVEAGHEYSELRGIQFEAEAIFHNDLEFVVDFAEELTTRYAPEGEKPSPEAMEAFRAQAAKRTVIEFKVVRTVSWDHRKLGGTY
ncbi:MAG: pyridoxamine 5'-phosphate oxidase family protein [Solirubrobacterales bacterium]